MKLIERERYLSILTNGFEQIKAGKGHCFFVLGEAGVGKSLLIKNFMNGIESPPCDIYSGACDSLFTPRPLAPVLDLAMQLKSGWVQKMDSNSSRSELFTQFLEELSQREKPAVLIFEDIHWADEATVDFIKFLARRISRTACMFILTCRDTEFHGAQMVTQVISELPVDSFTRMYLPPFTQEAVYKLAEEKGYSGENLFTLTNGNPFFVNEILESYSPGIPDNVKDSVLSIFNRQKGSTKNLWQIFSVVPDGLKINMLDQIDPEWEEALELCMGSKILITKNDRILFKHELYRRTIEESLSPFKRIKLNKLVLDLFLPHFKQNGEVEKIIHHAKNANINALVFKYAPSAAKKASKLGAHMDASKLYFTAIQYADTQDEEDLVRLYEAYAYECFLTNQIKEGIVYQGKALQIWKKKQFTECIGNSLWFLSRLWWFDGNRNQAEKFAYESVVLLEDELNSVAKGMAYSNLSQLKMFADQKEACIVWSKKAIEVADDLGDPGIMSHAMNNMGTVLWDGNEDTDQGKKYLYESLRIAVENGLDEHTARAQSNIILRLILVKDYATAQKQVEESILYCEERDLSSSRNFKFFLQAKILFETGKWKEAEAVLEGLLQQMTQPSAVKIGALTILTKIKIRRGDQDCDHYLKITKNMAFQIGEYLRIIPLALACLEYEWLTGLPVLSDEELTICRNLLKAADTGSLNGEFAYWYQKSRGEDIQIDRPYIGFDLSTNDKKKAALTFWNALPCPFEKALVLMEGDESDKKQALIEFQELGAVAFAEKLKKIMRSTGIKSIPRGKRASTLNNPAQLTNREIDVLALLKDGAQNKEIAGSLFISPKTVDHHITSLLFKLDVSSRTKAVAEAIRLGILK